MIDYERVIQQHERKNKQLTDKEVEDELERERQRIWRFLSEHVIMPAGTANRHQEIIKIFAQKNIQRKHEKKLKEQEAAKEAFKMQLRKNELMLQNDNKGQ